MNQTEYQIAKNILLTIACRKRKVQYFVITFDLTMPVLVKEVHSPTTLSMVSNRFKSAGYCDLNSFIKDIELVFETIHAYYRIVYDIKLNSVLEIQNEVQKCYKPLNS